MLNLRPAEPDDEKWWLELRNERSVRAASFTTDPISEETHHAWFLGRLASEACKMLIVENDGGRIGWVRLDISPTEAEINIALIPAVRGRGLGKEAIGLAVAETTLLIRARIRSDNLPSLAAFRSAGFITESETETVSELLYARD